MEDYIDLLNAMFFVESFDEGQMFNVNARRNDKNTGKSIAGVTETTFNGLIKDGRIPKDSERFNVHDEVRAGIVYFKQLLERPYIKGDGRKAVAAYHMGQGAFNRLQKKHGKSWEKHLNKSTKQHLENTYNALANNEAVKKKYNLENDIPLYQPIIDVMMEMKNEGNLDLPKMREGGGLQGDPIKSIVDLRNKILDGKEFQIQDNQQPLMGDLIRAYKAAKNSQVAAGVEFKDILNEIWEIGYDEIMLMAPTFEELDSMGTPMDVYKSLQDSEMSDFKEFSDIFLRQTMSMTKKSVDLETERLSKGGKVKTHKMVKKAGNGDYITGLPNQGVSYVGQAKQDANGNWLPLSNGLSGSSLPLLGGAMSTAGSGLTAYNINQEDPNLLAGIGGGALQGAGALSALGPWGMLAGAVGGGAMGAINTLKTMTENAQQDYAMRRNYIQNRSMSPNKGIPSLNDGGVVTGVEVQTEKGETVLLPDLSVVDVAARKKHKNMKDDEVTDLLPEGAYVFSNQIELEKDKVSETILGTEPVVYKEGELPNLPKDVTLEEFFGGKKKETVANLSKNIREKYKITDTEDSVLSVRTQEENRISRALRLPLLAQMNEEKKNKGKRKPKEDRVEQMSDGGLISKLPQLNEEAYQELLARSNRLDSTLSGLAGLDFLQRSFFNFTQDPTETPFMERASYLDRRFAAPPRSLYNSQISAINAPMNTNARILQQAGVSPRDLATLMAKQNSQRLAAINQAAANQINQEVAMDRARYGELNRVQNVNEQQRIAALNATRTNRNRLLANQAEIGSGLLQNLGNLESSSFSRNNALFNQKMVNDLMTARVNRGTSNNPFQANVNTTSTFNPVVLPDSGMYSHVDNLNAPTIPLPSLPIHPLNLTTKPIHPLNLTTQPIPDNQLILDDANFLPNLSNIG